jgi:hypothetical protein
MEEKKESESEMQIDNDQTALTLASSENSPNLQQTVNTVKRTRTGNPATTAATVPQFVTQSNLRNPPIQQPQQQSPLNQPNPSTDQFLKIVNVFNEIAHLAVPYPSVNDISAILRTKDDLAVLGKPLLDGLVMDVVKKRIDAPMACEALTTAICNNLSAAESQWHPQPSNAASHLLALTWAVVSNITENYKSELLRAEYFQLRADIDRLHLASPNTTLYSALDYLYDQRTQNIVNGVRQLNNEICLMLSQNVRLYAMKTIRVDPDMLSTGLPNFLVTQLQQFSAQQALATELPSATNTWVQVTTGSTTKSRAQQALSTGPTPLTLAPMYRTAQAQPVTIEKPTFAPLTPRILQPYEQACDRMRFIRPDKLCSAEIRRVLSRVLS